MHTHTQLRTPRRAARESQSAWLGQLSCEVSYADWTYADPFRFLFCADLLVGASSCHDFVLSFVGKGRVGVRVGVGVTRCMECVRVWLRTMLVSSGLVGFACACRKSKRRNAVTETWDLKNAQTLYVHAHSLVEYLDNTYMVTLTRGKAKCPPPWRYHP